MTCYAHKPLFAASIPSIPQGFALSTDVVFATSPKYATTAHARDFWVRFFRTLIQKIPDLLGPIRLRGFTSLSSSTKNNIKNCTSYLTESFFSDLLRENSIHCCCRCVSETVDSSVSKRWHRFSQQ